MSRHPNTYQGDLSSQLTSVEVKRCMECYRVVSKDARRGLCRPCYRDPEIRKNYPTLPRGYWSPESRAWDDIDVGRLRKFFSRGYSDRYIAKRLRRSVGSVTKCRQRLGMVVSRARQDEHKRVRPEQENGQTWIPKLRERSVRSIKEIFRSYAQFDSEGRHVNGTDKQSNHNYGDAYESLFTRPVDTDLGEYSETWSTRDKVKLMMEVGVADGSCLLAWREIFPNATIVGMDIHHSDKAYGDRIEFHLGDQREKEHCERAAAGRQFDLIVEDATHRLQDTLLTLIYLWPFVKPGGLYVVEEFDNVGGLRGGLRTLFPHAQIIDTDGPFGGTEPLVVFRKPK